MSFGAEVQRKTAEPSSTLPGDSIGRVFSVVNTRFVSGVKATPFRASLVYPPDEADVDYPRECVFKVINDDAKLTSALLREASPAVLQRYTRSTSFYIIRL